MILLDVAAHPVIGHRGAAARAPENTRASFDVALAAGADALELDVHLSADGEPVVIHDATLDRTTDLQGAVARLSLARIRAADAGARFTRDGGRTFPFRGRGIIVPTLGEVVRAYPDVPLLLEIKTPAAQRAVREVLVAEGAEGRCVVAASEAAALEVFPHPPFLRGASSRDVARLLRCAWLRAEPGMVPYQLLAIPERQGVLPVATARLVALARRLGCPTHVWTVDDPARAARLWRRGVAGIVTNDPAVIRAARGAVARVRGG